MHSSDAALAAGQNDLPARQGIVGMSLRSLLSWSRYMIRIFAFGAVVVALAGTTACTDLSPLQAQVDDLKQQVTRISSDEVILKSAVDSSAQTASRALSAAEHAQNRADAAASAAQAAQQSCDAVNDKIDRMFKKALSK
jgi:hypothetical protein